MWVSKLPYFSIFFVPFDLPKTSIIRQKYPFGAGSGIKLGNFSSLIVYCIGLNGHERLNEADDIRAFTNISKINVAFRSFPNWQMLILISNNFVVVEHWNFLSWAGSAEANNCSKRRYKVSFEMKI